MKERLNIFVTFLFWIIVIASVVVANDRWQSGFDTSGTPTTTADSVFTLDDVLGLVAVHNPSLHGLDYKREAARQRLRQAGLWQNPEFDTEFEEVGWDAPGLSESEITISLSQEFEIFGQRRARRQVALTEIESTNIEIELAAFDLYLETKSRFNKLLHSQRQAELADSSVILAESIVKSIEHRMKQGVALQSEILLAQLELQRVGLTNEEAQQVLFSAQVALSALWNGNSTNITVSAPEEPDFRRVLKVMPSLSQQIDSTRYVRQLQIKTKRTHAERRLSSLEAKPDITLSGGFKRLEANNSNSFLFGISLPLPLFNRNQGKTAALDATIQSQEFEQERARIETKAYIIATISLLNQLINRHAALDSLLLPTAEKTYATVKGHYDVGRIPFTSLLEAERSLIELRFQHNDALNAINEQLIAIEQISGIRIN